MKDSQSSLPSIKTLRDLMKNEQRRRRGSQRGFNVEKMRKLLVTLRRKGKGDYINQSK